MSSCIFYYTHIVRLWLTIVVNVRGVPTSERMELLKCETSLLRKTYDTISGYVSVRTNQQL